MSGNSNQGQTDVQRSTISLNLVWGALNSSHLSINRPKGVLLGTDTSTLGASTLGGGRLPFGSFLSFIVLALFPMVPHSDFKCGCHSKHTHTLRVGVSALRSADSVPTRVIAAGGPRRAAVSPLSDTRNRGTLGYPGNNKGNTNTHIQAAHSPHPTDSKLILTKFVVRPADESSFLQSPQMVRETSLRRE